MASLAAHYPSPSLPSRTRPPLKALLNRQGWLARRTARPFCGPRFEVLATASTRARSCSRPRSTASDRRKEGHFGMPSATTGRLPRRPSTWLSAQRNARPRARAWAWRTAAGDQLHRAVGCSVQAGGQSCHRFAGAQRFTQRREVANLNRESSSASHQVGKAAGNAPLSPRANDLARPGCRPARRPTPRTSARPSSGWQTGPAHLSALMPHAQELAPPVWFAANRNRRA